MGPGECLITATQPGNNNYNAASYIELNAQHLPKGLYIIKISQNINGNFLRFVKE